MQTFIPADHTSNDNTIKTRKNGLVQGSQRNRTQRPIFAFYYNNFLRTLIESEEKSMHARFHCTAFYTYEQVSRVNS